LSGPLGYLSLSAHGHADIEFNFECRWRAVSDRSRNFRLPPSPKEWRGTAAHNTVRIDETDQSVIGGNFMWLKKARSRPVLFESTGSYDHVSGWHDGYLRLSDPVKHLRDVYFDKINNLITIMDRIEAQKEHSIEQCFHFAINCIIAQRGEKNRS
jgi:hypothetical protein